MEIMSFHLILLIVSLGTFLHDLHVSSCDANCADKPVFSPSRLVVQYGDPVSAGCSVCQHACLSGASGLEVSVGHTQYHGTTILWSVHSLTEWDTSALCYYTDDVGYQCCSRLPVTVYKPPRSVSISFVNHTGLMLEGHQYTLQCTVQDVAPVEKLTVTFYKGQTALGPQQSNSNTEQKTPVTEIFTLNITPSKEDDGVQYWCEARLELGPEGPQPPPVVTSPKLTASILFGPQLVCPTKLQVREGESLSCEVRGNPQPSVTWFRDGQVVALPARLSRRHAGKYTVLAKGLLEQKNFTVEVEVLRASGSTNSCDRHVLVALLLVQMISSL